MRAELELVLTNREGRVDARRRAHNSVMIAGAELVANLFAGRGAPITHMAVGTNGSAEPGDFETTALTNDASSGTEPLQGETRAALAPDAFTIARDLERRHVVVRVRGTLARDHALGQVREAGLLAAAEGAEPILYNRVTFAPIHKRDDHELTLFWEVSFPYGDLQWLV